MATRLRDRMVAEMEVRGLKETTRKQYLDDVEKFFEFYKDKPPMKIGVEEWIGAIKRHFYVGRLIAINVVTGNKCPEKPSGAV